MARRDGWAYYTDSAFSSIPKNLQFFSVWFFNHQARDFPKKK
jgi:hypothetical protein